MNRAKADSQGTILVWWAGASLKRRCRVKPIFLDLLYFFDKPLRSTSEWLVAGEAEAGSAGEQPVEE
jgi:hypothetical protein